MSNPQPEKNGYSFNLFKPLVIELLLSLSHFYAGSVYDYYFHMGEWNVWTDAISKEDSKIPDGASVSVFSTDAMLLKMLKLPCF